MIINKPQPLAEVTAEFERYEVALMANDIEVLDALFWKSGFTLRYGIEENLIGSDAIARFRVLRPGGSPPRLRHNVVITTFGDDFATANTEFRRVRPAAAVSAALPGPGLIGRQSQAWVRFDFGWRIVAAHVSLIPAP